MSFPFHPFFPLRYNSSKYGKGQAWHKHCCCRMAAPGHHWNSLMLLWQGSPEPISAQPLLCLQERPNPPAARMDPLLQCLCVPPGCQQQGNPNIQFQKMFFPLKLSGLSLFFIYKLKQESAHLPSSSLHVPNAADAEPGTNKHSPAQSSAYTWVHPVAFSQSVLENHSTAGPEIILANSTGMWKKITEKTLILVTWRQEKGSKLSGEF